MFLAMGAIVLMLVVACSPKTVSTTTSTTVKDSTYTKEVARKDTVTDPADSVFVYKYIECDQATNKPKPFTEKVKSGKLSAEVSVDNKGQLKVKCKEDSLQHIIQLMDKEIFNKHIEIEKIKSVAIEYKVPKFYKWCLYWFIFSIMGAAVYLYLKLK